MKLEIITQELSICRMEAKEQIPSWAIQGDFFSIAKTPDELSIVCEERFVPQGVTSNRPWRAIKVIGPLDFSLVGILSSLTSVLARAGISLFAISTFDTDYILVKSDRLDDARNALNSEGHIFVEGSFLLSYPH